MYTDEKRRMRTRTNSESLIICDGSLRVLCVCGEMMKKMEAAIGFEPMNEGFADLCLSHLATPPVLKFGVMSWELGVER